MPESPKPSRFQNVLAILLSTLIAVAAMFFLELMTEGSIVGFRAQESALDITTSTLHNVATALGCDSTGHTFTINGSALWISAPGVFGPLDRLLLLAAVAIAATVAACRTWGLSTARTLTAITLSTLLSLPLLLILPGAFAGLALGFSDTTSSAASAAWLARDAGLTLSCAIIAFIWWLAAAIRREHKIPPTTMPTTRHLFTASMSAAVATACLLAIFRLLAALGLTIHLFAQSPEITGDRWLAIRWAIGAAILLASAIMIFTSIFGTSLVRWAWIPLLTLIPLGSGAAAAIPLLAAIVASRDQRFLAARGRPLPPAAPTKIARRSQYPLTPSIWLLTTLLACSGYAHLGVAPDHYTGLDRLAHPAIFLSLLILASACIFLTWNRTRRQTHRLLTASAFPALLVIASVAFYCERYRRDAAYRREVIAAEPYFQQVQTILARFPASIGPWVGTDVENPLNLQPHSLNAVLSRRYRDTCRALQADLLIVHTRDVRELLEYAPSYYYPSNGFTVESSKITQWTVGTHGIATTEFDITHPQTFTIAASSFSISSLVVVPDGQILPDLFQLKSPKNAIKGGAQFLIIIPGNISPDTHRQITTEMLTAVMPIIQTIANQP